MIKTKLEKVFDYLQDNIINVVAITLQLALVFSLIYYSIDMHLNFQDIRNKIEKKISNDELYYITNNEDYTIKLYKKNDIEQYKKFYDYLNENYKVLNYRYNNIFIPTNSIDGELRKNELRSINEFSLFTGHWVNNDFFDYFNISVSEGRKFEKKDFILNSLEEDTPVILGNSFKQYFKLGDNIEFKDHDYSGIIRSLKVIGFLEEDEYIINKPVMMTNVTNLNYSILLPNTPINTQLVDLKDIEVINKINLNLYKDITESFFILDRDRDVQDIKKKSEEMNFFDITLNSSSNNINDVKKIFYSEQSINIIILLIVLIAVSMEIFINIMCSIRRRKKEFLIYYTFGANKKYILDLIIMQKNIYFISGVFTSIIFINLFKKFGLISLLNMWTFLITVLVFMVIMAINNIIMYIYINKIKCNFH